MSTKREKRGFILRCVKPGPEPTVPKKMQIEPPEIQWEEPNTSGSKHRKARGSPTDHCKGRRSWTGGAGLGTGLEVRAGVGVGIRCRCGKILFYFSGEHVFPAFLVPR